MRDKESSDKIKIMIVGDYLIFRHGLRMLIESRKNFKVVSEVSNLSDVGLVIGNSKPNVLLVDSSEIVDDDFESFISKYCDGIPSIVLTNSNSERMHQRYLLIGASGVVTKEQDADILFKAIERVNSDDLWFNRQVIKKVIETLIRERYEAPEKLYSNKYAILTEREREVLSSICLGMKNKEIADSLFITETTVRHHLTSIFEKLNVKSRLALAILAFNEGLIEVPPKENKFASGY